MTGLLRYANAFSSLRSEAQSLCLFWKSKSPPETEENTIHGSRISLGVCPLEPTAHSVDVVQNEEVLKKGVRHYPLRRVGVPVDIVPMVLLFAFHRPSYDTGQTISISGGHAM